MLLPLSYIYCTFMLFITYLHVVCVSEMNADSDIFCVAYFAQMRIICKFICNKLEGVMLFVVILYFLCFCFDAELLLGFCVFLFFFILWFHNRVFTVKSNWQMENESQDMNTVIFTTIWVCLVQYMLWFGEHTCSLISCAEPSQAVNGGWYECGFLLPDIIVKLQ